MKVLVVCSGGLDSISLAYKIAASHQLIGLISFNYGQRHVKELEFAALCARRLAVPHDIIDISNVGKHLTGSALTDDVKVPDGHYDEETQMPWRLQSMAETTSSTQTVGRASFRRLRSCNNMPLRDMPMSACSLPM
jgi:7-cyano-7-deazaguanine synthase in queuosine biosynthesis